MVLVPLVLTALLSACGSGTPDYSVSAEAASTIPAGRAGTSSLSTWPQFGLDPQRLSTSSASVGITADNVGHLRRRRVSLPGTADAAPVYARGALIAGARHNVVVLTTTYGRTVAIDDDSGQLLWTFTPRGYSAWAGSAQITNTTPLLDPDRAHVFAASPDGRIHKLALSDGRELIGRGFPVAVTRDPAREKLAAALNIDGRYLVVSTGGYTGDPPPYQGRVELIDRHSGSLVAVWNALCANRRGLLIASSCPASGAAIWSRAGAVIEPGGRRLLVATGNGPYNGRSNFGDSVIELTVPGLRVRQVYTPTDQAHLNSTDTDLGSSSPVLLGSGLVSIAGKDGVLRVLRLAALDGHRPGGAPRVGGERQRLSTPGGAGLFTAPAVWRQGGRTTLFLADFQGTGAYVLQGGHLRAAWSNSTPGTSPVLAGGLLYVYDPGGGVNVYRPGSPRAIARLACGPGHWNSPIVIDGHVIEAEGNANDHRQSGVLDLFSEHG